MKNKGRFTLFSIFNSFHFAIAGIVFSFLNERNFRIHLIGLGFMICSAIYFRFSYLEWALCIGIAASVFALELLNTSIEKVVDLCSPEWQSLAKIAKDCSAGAVLVMAIASVLVWLLIVLDKL